SRGCRSPATAAAGRARRGRPRGQAARAAAPVAGRSPLQIRERGVDVARVLVDLALRGLLVALLANLAEQLLGQLRDRCLHVACRLARTQRVALEPDRRLGDLVLRDRRVLLDG